MRWLLVFALLCSCTGDDVIYGAPDGNMPSEAGFVSDTGVTMMDSTVQEAAPESSTDAPADAPTDAIVDVSLDVTADVAVSCNNNIQDGTETDVDCGGMSCPKCGTGKMCSKNPDCQSNSCKNNVCQ